MIAECLRKWGDVAIATATLVGALIGTVKHLLDPEERMR